MELCPEAPLRGHNGEGGLPRLGSLSHSLGKTEEQARLRDKAEERSERALVEEAQISLKNQTWPG